MAGLGCLAAWKWACGFHALAVLTGLLATGSLVAGGVMAEARGKIRYPESRIGAPLAEGSSSGERQHIH